MLVIYIYVCGLIENCTFYIILGENQYQQKAQGDVDYGSKVAKSTKESRRCCINNRNRNKIIIIVVQEIICYIDCIISIYNCRFHIMYICVVKYFFYLKYFKLFYV